ncbi:T9SS type B sorting domain-containing protein [Flavobacterium sp. W20_MBD1_R3]|uniref:T9SS type B sorting domain-containing protein n=1 Tax=Flavobacterium sp. W20_MBD1_R3 TaxID=3240278 RepID=UPI003F92D5C7
MSSQTIQWQKTIGGNDYDWSDFIEVSNDGNYILGGYSYSNISDEKSENSRGEGDYWFIKIDDTSGNLLWQKTIGGNRFDHLTSGKETKDGGYILGGYSSSGISGEKTQSSRGADDYWIVKLDVNRNIIWDKTFGGTGVDRLTSIIETSDGGYLMGGSSDSNISGEKTENSRGSLDMWIIKTDSSGNIMWQKTFGGSGSDWVQSMVKTPDGGYLIAGSSLSNISGDKTQNSRGGSDYWILKIDSSGAIVWQKTIGGNNGDYAKSLLVTSDGNYLIGGNSFSTISGEKTENKINNSDDAWLVKLNNDGQILWQKVIGANDTESLSDIRMTSDNGFILGIMSYSGISGYKTEISRGDRDYWIVKLDSNGKFEWDKTIGGDSLDQSQSIVQAKDGGYVTLGWSQSNISGDKTENKSGLQDFWVVKLKMCSQNLSATSNSPMCIGNTIELKASGGTNYAWTGPNGFTSMEQNPTIPNATALNSGQYSCNITGTGGCDDTKTVDIIVGDIESPIPNLTVLPIVNGDCNTVITTIPTATDSCAGAITATTANALSYNLPGTYTVVWNYNDGNGNTSTQNQTITISNQPVPTSTSPQTFCVQQNATLSEISIIGQNIKWYDALTNGTLLSDTTPPQNGTTYYASQTISGCESERIPVLINIQNTPAPTGTTNQTLCSSQNPTLETIVISGNAIKWYNSFGVLLSNSTSLQDGMTYYASQTENNCESPNKLAVTISLTNTLPANNYEELFCADLNDGSEKVNLSVYDSKLVSNTSGYTFSYYSTFLGAENQLTGNQITNFLNYKLALGENKIYVRINSTTPCYAIVELKLTLLAKPVISIPDVVPICENNSITIDAGSGFDTYLWSTGATTSSILVANPGNYSVTVTTNYSTISCSTTKNFEIRKSNVATINSVETKDWTDNQNIITVFASGAGDFEYSIDGVHFQDSSQFSALYSGEYTVHVRDKNGCGTATDHVFLLMYPKYFTPNDDGFNDTWNIKFSDLETNLTIKIFDRYGKLIKELIQNGSWNGTMNGYQLPSDDYWFIATRTDGTVYRGHFSLKR